MNIDEWNRKIYKNEDGSSVGDGLNAKEFYEEFGIESAPLFRDRCYFHIPERWAEDVRVFIHQVQSELGNRIDFTQIKEKWCILTVYYDFADEEADKRLKELQKECVGRLAAKGVHPERK